MSSNNFETQSNKLGRANLVGLQVIFTFLLSPFNPGPCREPGDFFWVVLCSPGTLGTDGACLLAVAADDCADCVGPAFPALIGSLHGDLSCDFIMTSPLIDGSI